MNIQWTKDPHVSTNWAGRGSLTETNKNARKTLICQVLIYMHCNIVHPIVGNGTWAFWFMKRKQKKYPTGICKNEIGQNNFIITKQFALLLSFLKFQSFQESTQSSTLSRKKGLTSHRKGFSKSRLTLNYSCLSNSYIYTPTTMAWERLNYNYFSKFLFPTQ